MHYIFHEIHFLSYRSFSSNYLFQFKSIIDIKLTLKVRKILLGKIRPPRKVMTQKPSKSSQSSLTGFRYVHPISSINPLIYPGNIILPLKERIKWTLWWERETKRTGTGSETKRTETGTNTGIDRIENSLVWTLITYSTHSPPPIIVPNSITTIGREVPIFPIESPSLNCVSPIVFLVEFVRPTVWFRWSSIFNFNMVGATICRSSRPLMLSCSGSSSSSGSSCSGRDPIGHGSHSQH